MNKILPILLFLTLNCNAKYDVKNLPWINPTHTEIEYAAPFLPDNPVILEAGVCNAQDTICMKKRWPNSTIYGFEALPHHFSLATQNTKHLTGITLYQKALFNKLGTFTFYLSHVLPGASSLLKDNLASVKEAATYSDEPITVECTTIDEWAKNNNIKKVDYLWLDTEGAELYILKHSTTILKTIKVISIEANFREFRTGMTMFPELYDFLIEQKFVLKYIWGSPEWQAVAIFVNSTL